ncbi:AraC family transcriptional regulator ligand-binding domain-containing protein [Halarcobacter sp.]|uniref:AraC family transcriptional regulator ligand-binding domain-containing protein n=1 Tax=Halarcobacter sp. TaxID=2321133 RepID=UPI003AFF6457
MNANFPLMLFNLISNLLESKYNFNKEKYFKENNINKIDIEEVNDLLDFCIQEYKSYEILIELSKQAKPKDLGILGYLVLNSSSIAHSLKLLSTYYCLIGNSIKPTLLKTNEYYKLSIYSNSKEEGILNIEHNKIFIHLFAFLHLLNELSSKEIVPKYINLMQDKLFDTKYISNIKVNFSQDENAIYFDKDIENINLISANKNEFEYYKNELEQLLNLNLNKESYKTKISALVFSSIMELDISLETISKKLDLHPRVLQKRLKKEKISYSHIVEDIRKKLCLYYLKKGLDTTTISIYLCYKETNSFFRSFKKWFNQTPKQYKKELEKSSNDCIKY